MRTNCISMKPYSAQQGFTLIELMLVIVIMSVFAGLVVISISGVEQRKLMQQRDQLINDLNIVRLESVDQGRVFALITTSANATGPAGYFFAEYQPPETDPQTGLAMTRQEKKPLWQPVEAFKSRSLSENAFLQIRSMDNSPQIDGPEGLLDQTAPDLIWFGHGEVKPARLQLIFNGQPIGEPVYVNSVGMLSDTEQGSS